jgi:hypothetical protein
VAEPSRLIAATALAHSRTVVSADPLGFEENRRARSVVLWETKEGADEAERQFGAKREEIVRGMGGTVRSADLYEAPIIEVLAGARA